MKHYSVILLFCFAGAACAPPQPDNANAPTKTTATANNSTNNAPVARNYNETSNAANTAVERVNPRAANTANTAAAKNECLGVKMPGKRLDAKQTFPFDSRPFEKACFVTFHEPDFTDPPLGSRFFIFKDGKQVYEFPDQTEAGGFWAEAVAFEDLNDDGMTDVIVAGRVGAKSGVLNTNFVYANTGDGFMTQDEGNIKLDDFKTTKEIANFVRRNQNLFF